MAENTRTGGCLCGAVRFEVEVPRARFSVCHCAMCRRWSAGPYMSVHCARPAVFLKDAGLAWYRSSAWAERGFCSRCGSVLFWRPLAKADAMTEVSVEALDDAADFALDRHIYVDAQPARYAFADDRPRLSEAEVMEEVRAKEK